MVIAILGASGYIGQNLIKQLLRLTHHNIIALSPHAETITIQNPRLTKFNVDIVDTLKLKKYLKSCDVVYYLVHMMGQNNPDFTEAENLAVESFCQAVKESAIKRVIYLGGLGDDETRLSKHLTSRHHTGEIIRKNLLQSIEFRASIIIGKGSVSYDIISNLVNKLPILVLPKWFATLVQPIGLEDTISYLISGIILKTDRHEIIEIGGPEHLSYESLMKRYAIWKGKKVFIIRLPVMPFAVATWWLNLFVSKRQAKIGIAMVESLANEMIVTNDRAKQLFPQITPKPLEDVFV